MKELVDIEYNTKGLKVLEWFLKHKAGFCADMEKDLFLREPDSSIITKEFVKRKWLTLEKIEKYERGRPRNLYKLSKSIDEILTEISVEIKQKINILQGINDHLLKIKDRYD